MTFEIEVGELPGSVTEFKGAISRRMGDPALVIRNDEGNMPETAAYSKPLDEFHGVSNVETFEVGDVEIQTGETEVKGSTVLPDGSVENWVRDAVAYYPATIDSFGDTDAVYLFPKAKKRAKK